MVNLNIYGLHADWVVLKSILCIYHGDVDDDNADDIYVVVEAEETHCVVCQAFQNPDHTHCHWRSLIQLSFAFFSLLFCHGWRLRI